jgi:hypothetical protein
MNAESRPALLDPATRLGEVLFGLIMVLTFTGSLHVASAGREEVRTMLIAALGCNLAWGIVDAVMYAMDDLLYRNRALHDLRRLQAARTDEEADGVIASRLADEFAGVLEPGDLAGLRERLRRTPPPPARARITRRVLAEAFAVFLLVFCCTLPAAAPFLVFEDVSVALRVSNGIVLAMMFVSGILGARHAGLPPLKTGFGVAAIGVVLVAITMLLGG